MRKGGPISYEATFHPVRAHALSPSALRFLEALNPERVLPRPVGLRVSGCCWWWFGVRVWDFWVGVENSRFRVSVGCRVQSVGCRVQGSGRRM